MNFFNAVCNVNFVKGGELLSSPVVEIPAESATKRDRRGKGKILEDAIIAGASVGYLLYRKRDKIEKVVRRLMK